MPILLNAFGTLLTVLSICIMIYIVKIALLMSNIHLHVELSWVTTNTDCWSLGMFINSEVRSDV